MSTDVQEATIAGLRHLGLLSPDGAVELVALTGGVASDIWLVRAAERTFVVKRALEKLRVAADWRAPVSRNACEVAWLVYVEGIAPAAVPRILAHSPDLGFFAMNYLPSDTHPVWKRELKDGHIDPSFAFQVGKTLAEIHAATARSPEIAPDFNDDSVFSALRIEPYLEFTGGRHPEIKRALFDLGARILGNHTALVHGDVSPKNILVGSKGPVFLDAECAWYGDPVFDLAFCLNHLLLKCLWVPAEIDRYLLSFDAIAAGYVRGVDWEDYGQLEARAAALLPALLLGRIDGRSPVEYVTDDGTKSLVRAFAIPLIQSPPQDLATIRKRWAAALKNGRTSL